MHVITRVCGVLFFAAALAVAVMSFVDTAADIAAANEAIGNQPIASTVRFRIGFPVALDVIIAVILALFGWFLWSSEIQQTWAVVMTGLLVIGSVVIRVEPLLPIDVGRVSPGLAFWGAQVIDDFYPPPMVPDQERRRWQTFPMDRYYYLAVTEENLPGNEPHPDRSVMLNFNHAPEEMARFFAQGYAGSQIIGNLAGNRAVLDYDHRRKVYLVPHIMVQEIAPVGARKQE